MSHDSYLPLTARSVALPTLPQGTELRGSIDHHPIKHEVVKKQDSSGEPAKGDENTQQASLLPVSAEWNGEGTGA